MEAIINPVFYVYKHSGDPEGGLLEDPTLQSVDGFATFEAAVDATKGLFPHMFLVMLRGPYSGVIVSIRRPWQRQWPPASAAAGADIDDS
jgi:hypothetical protein